VTKDIRLQSNLVACEELNHNNKFKAGGVGFRVRDVFQGVEIDRTRDVECKVLFV
jgi:hypothetical protein